MTTLLFANVGNHDLKLTDPSLLPDEMQGRRVPYRTLGKELLAVESHKVIPGKVS